MAIHCGIRFALTAASLWLVACSSGAKLTIVEHLCDGGVITYDVPSDDAGMLSVTQMCSDAGTPADAGGASDAGIDPHDGASVGSACATVGAQSTCDPTEVCVALSENNMCSRTCSNDADCGENPFDGGPIANRCIDEMGNSLCMRGCDPNAPGSCKRDDFVCVTQGQGAEDYCAPDCRRQPTGFCPYPQLCDQASGQCQGMTCTPGSSVTQCPSGLICAETNGQDLCVTSCEEDGCPSGSTCNATGGCDSVFLPPYASCGGVGDVCGEGTECATFGGDAVCLLLCEPSDGGCDAGVCVPQSGGSGLCVPVCSDGAACPMNTTCQANSAIADGGLFCLP